MGEEAHRGQGRCFSREPEVCAKKCLWSGALVKEVVET